ncbi:hypothetical protein OG552_28645 [Streptomyces sp. NBC_01476]|uniref:hypothetical protein n=1 Tax=Streptomyces sp. NBC_01476 TaxID=2903881 RepID=UPI002E374340|nr:hypothetical protein [Streptomyces sp. NBC_01476]
MKYLPSRSRPCPRPRARLRALARVPGCLALTCGLLLVAADGSSAFPVPPLGAVPRVPTPGIRPLPAPPGADDRGGTSLHGSVAPVDTEVARDQNGDFTLTVVNTGSATAQDVQVLMERSDEGNTVGASDGRCLGRVNTASPADLWCDLGDVAPLESVSVDVHAFMSTCVRAAPAATSTPLHAVAFRWRVRYTDSGRALTLNAPTPRWTCGTSRHQADLDTDPAARRP